MMPEHSRIHLRLGGDPRLAAGVAGAVENCAGQVGFDAADGANLAAVVRAVCRQAVEQAAGEESALDVTIECSGERVAVIIEHAGAAPAVGLDSFAASTPEVAGAPGGAALLRDVDRIEFSAQSGRARTTLVKFLPKKASAD